MSDSPNRTDRPRVLILGCGYLGARLARRLIAAGHAVTGTTRSEESAPAVLETGAAHALWSSTDPDAVGRLAELAGATPWIFFAAAPSRGMSYGDVYLKTARHMAAALPATAPEAVVVVSSSSVYGVSDGSWVDETVPAQPPRRAGETLLEMERTLLETPGLPVRVVRSVGIYGPERTPAHRLDSGEAFVGTGEEWVNLIFVDDLARILERVAERGRNGAVYLAADGAPVRRRDYYAEAARLAGLPEPRFSGGGAGPHFEGLGKRVRSELLAAELDLELRYPDYRAGLAASAPPVAGGGGPASGPGYRSGPGSASIDADQHSRAGGDKS
jgi:nucleoside-diphosphate-sugar epimerase